MVETVTVFLSGPAFSLLLYENVRSDYTQEGFLLGEIIERKSNSITDHDDQVVKISRDIKVNSAIPAPTVNYFYDATGKIDGRKLRTFLGNERDKVIAWYKFKRLNGFKLFVRDKIFHKNLAKHLGLAENLFSCCLLTSSIDRDNAMHFYTQTFVRYNKPVFQYLPIHIVNLSDPSHVYRNPEPSSEVFNKLFQSLSIDKHTQSVSVITKVNAALQKHTDDLVVKLCKAETKMYELEQQIMTYKQKIKEKKDDKITNNLVPMENGDNVNDNLSQGNPQECNSKKGAAKGKRSRNNSLKGVSKDDDDKVELRTSNRILRTPGNAQSKTKK